MKAVFVALVSYSIFTVSMLLYIDHLRRAKVPPVEPAAPRHVEKPAVPTVETPGVYQYREVRPTLPDPYFPGADDVVTIQPEALINLGGEGGRFEKVLPESVLGEQWPK